MKDIISRIFRKAGLTKGYDGSLPGEIYESYYQSRTIAHKKHLCHAPFNNMYFNSVGDIANCWLTFDNPEKYSEDRTLMEIWQGEKFTSLRNNIKNFNLGNRCKTCQYYLEHHNHVNILARAYDNEYPITDFPSMMEFELTNTCNLECTMCTGLLSSSIRSNREKLPPLKSPYGKKFVEELKEFIPHLYEARFNGGEPFMIPIYLEIWELIFQLNPKCKIVVATNGTALNSRVKDLLDKGNFDINLSIDSLDVERYASIRVNSDLNKVLDNFQYFREYCKKNSRNLCIMINPMRNNWREMPDFVNFCNENNVHLWYNSIIYPENLSIWSLSHAELTEIYDTLSKAKFDKPSSAGSGIFKYNTNTYYNLINTQIKGWMEDAARREADQANSINPMSEGNPRDFFVQTLKEYFSASSTHSDTDRQAVYAKIQQMEDELSKTDKELNFYAVLNKSPIEIVVQHMLDNSTAELLDKLRSFYSNQLS